MGKLIIILLTFTSLILPILFVPFISYGQNFPIDQFAFFTIIPFTLSVFLALAIRADAKENKKSEWWNILAFTTLFFGWVIGIIYLYTTTKKYEENIAKTKEEYNRAFSGFEALNKNSSKFEWINPKVVDKSVLKNSEYKKSQEKFESLFKDAFKKKEKEVAYYDNGKPVYKKD